MRLITLPTLAALLLLAPTSTAQNNAPSAEEANSLVQAGRFQEAAAAWKKRAVADRNDGRAHFMHAYSLHFAGDLDAAHDAHIEAARFSQFTATALYNHACVHALRKEKDAAFTALREAIAAGFNNADQLQTDADMEALRGDGRFQALLLELNGSNVTELKSLPPERRFDFYLGGWTRRNGDRAERNLEVESAFDGSGLTVTSTDAVSGKKTDTSIFLYDENDGLWRQIWMSREGMTVILEGGFQNDAMVLNQVSQDGKAKTGARSVYTNVSASGFTYQWQTSADGGNTWETMATRIFTRSDA